MLPTEFPFEVELNIIDKRDIERTLTCEFHSTEDDWNGVDIDEDVAFEINAFDVDEFLHLNAYQLDPDKKKEGIWTMNGMVEVEIKSFKVK